MNLQAPPNLTPAGLEGSSEAGREWRALLDAGINDWGAWLLFKGFRQRWLLGGIHVPE
jgi:hypothetical protein